MPVFLTVLEVVAPVFLLAAVGFAWVKLGFEYRIEFVTRLAMNVSLPCLIFVALMQSEIDPEALTRLSIAAIAAYGIVTAICFVWVKLGRMKTRTYLAPLIFGNTGNLGLPLAFFAFGDDGLGYAVVVFAIMAIYSFTFGVWIVAGGGSLTKVLKEPLVAATILGGIFLWQGWETPTFLTNAIDLIGQIAIPVMLITLGVAVARLKPQGFLRALWISSFKLVICVASAWAAGSYFGLSAVPLAVLILQVATPIAVTSYLLAAKYEADADSVAGLVVVSTLLSVGYIPLLLLFLM